MKVLFYLMLVVNVVFYLWETTRGQGAGPAQVELKLPPSGEPIVLIEELPSVPRKAPSGVEEPPALIDAPLSEQESAEVTAPAVSEPPRAKSEPGCYWMGPFDNEAEARKAQDALPPELPGSEVQRRVGETTDGFWVLYPKADSVEQARINRQMLQEKGVHDLWLFDKGELQGAISLGLFKTRERAEQAEEHFRSRNIEVEIQPRKVRAEAPWLKLHWLGAPAELERLVGEGKAQACD